MRPFASLAALCAAVTLAGCTDVSQTAVSNAAPTPIAPTAADRASAAYAACLQAIATTTGRPTSDIAIFDYVYSEANTQIQATVAGADAPWRCLSSNDGVVAEVMYTGSEGAL